MNKFNWLKNVALNDICLQIIAMVRQVNEM